MDSRVAFIFVVFIFHGAIAECPASQCGTCTMQFLATAPTTAITPELVDAPGAMTSGVDGGGCRTFTLTCGTDNRGDGLSAVPSGMIDCGGPFNIGAIPPNSTTQFTCNANGQLVTYDANGNPILGTTQAFCLQSKQSCRTCKLAYVAAPGSVITAERVDGPGSIATKTQPNGCKGFELTCNTDSRGNGLSIESGAIPKTGNPVSLLAGNPGTVTSFGCSDDGVVLINDINGNPVANTSQAYCLQSKHSCRTCTLTYVPAPSNYPQNGLIDAPGAVQSVSVNGCKGFILTCAADARGDGNLVGSAGILANGQQIPLKNGRPGLQTPFGCTNEGNTTGVDAGGNTVVGIVKVFCLQTYKQCSTCTLEYVPAPQGSRINGLDDAPGFIAPGTNSAGCRIYTSYCGADQRGDGNLVGSAGILTNGSPKPIKNGPPGTLTSFTCNDAGQLYSTDIYGQLVFPIKQTFCLQTTGRYPCNNCLLEYIPAPASAQGNGLVDAPGAISFTKNAQGCRVFTLTCNADARGDRQLVASAAIPAGGNPVPIINGRPGLQTQLLCNAADQVQTTNINGQVINNVKQVFCVQTTGRAG